MLRLATSRSVHGQIRARVDARARFENHGTNGVADAVNDALSQQIAWNSTRADGASIHNMHIVVALL